MVAREPTFEGVENAKEVCPPILKTVKARYKTVKARSPPHVPLSCEYGIYKSVKARYKAINAKFPPNVPLSCEHGTYIGQLAPDSGLEFQVKVCQCTEDIVVAREPSFEGVQDAKEVCSPTPYTLNRTPCTLQPTPYTLRPTPYTLRPTPYTLHPTPHGGPGEGGS